MITAIEEAKALTIAYQMYIVEYQWGSIDINQSHAHAAEQNPKKAI